MRRRVECTWTAPAQTAGGSFDLTFTVNTDKVQLNTLEKVDGAVITVTPSQTGGSVDGGSWQMTPAAAQTITTSGHTPDDSFHLNGGDGSATWTVHYEVSKTSTSTLSGQEGPFTSQAEADAAAEAAKNAAIGQLQNEAQGMVDAAIAAARAQLANITFAYDEVTIPHGFDSTPGALGSHQTITVPANSSNDYPMKNDELLQKTFTEDVLTGVHKKNTGQLPQYYIENYHEGIVSKQMFREVQAEIARRNSKSAANQRKRRRGRYNSKYALSERLFCGDCGSPYKRVTWNIHGRKQIVWRCVNRIEYGTKFCGSSPSIPEEELHRAILKAVQGLAANFTDEVAAQINGILHDIQTGESAKPNLQEQLEQTQQEFDRLLEMSLDFDENTPFLDDKLKNLNSKIKHLKKVIADSAARQEKVGQPEMLLSAKDLQIQEYDDALTARVIEKITVRFRNEIEIRFIGGCQKTMQLK